MPVHPCARRNVVTGVADEGGVFQNRFPLGNRHDGYLVPRRDVLQRGHAFARDLRTRRDRGPRDDDIVARVKADDGRDWHQRLFALRQAANFSRFSSFVAG